MLSDAAKMPDDMTSSRPHLEHHAQVDGELLDAHRLSSLHLRARHVALGPAPPHAPWSSKGSAGLTPKVIKVPDMSGLCVFLHAATCSTHVAQLV